MYRAVNLPLPIPLVWNLAVVFARCLSKRGRVARAACGRHIFRHGSSSSDTLVSMDVSACAGWSVGQSDAMEKNSTGDKVASRLLQDRINPQHSINAQTHPDTAGIEVERNSTGCPCQQAARARSAPVALSRAGWSPLGLFAGGGASTPPPCKARQLLVTLPP